MISFALVAQMVKTMPAIVWRPRFDPWIREKGKATYSRGIQGTDEGEKYWQTSNN